MNGVVEMCSLQFPKRAQWHIREIGEKTGDWADYLRGATWALSNRFPLTVGLCGVIEGSLPIGGLSSSAAVILSFLEALCQVNGIKLSSSALISIAFEAEKKYVGVNVGTLDQSCEVLSKKDHLLYLDCKDNHYELIPTNPNMKPYKIAVFFSGLEHSLAGSKYNMRVDELRSGVYALQAFAGLEYGKFNEANARDVSYEIYQTYKDKLPVQWAKRCEHWYTEFKRVEAGAEAWRRGDLEEYGRLSFESGWSSIHNWESGAPEQIKLYEIMRETNGIYGGRFSGAGFKGCCMALIDPSKTDAIREEVERKYLTAFPEMRGKYSFHLCESADGVGQKTED
jgi:GHMP kinase family protein